MRIAIIALAFSFTRLSYSPVWSGCEWWNPFAVEQLFTPALFPAILPAPLF